MSGKLTYIFNLLERRKSMSKLRVHIYTPAGEQIEECAVDDDTQYNEDEIQDLAYDIFQRYCDYDFELIDDE